MYYQDLGNEIFLLSSSHRISMTYSLISRNTNTLNFHVGAGSVFHIEVLSYERQKS